MVDPVHTSWRGPLAKPPGAWPRAYTMSCYFLDTPLCIFWRGALKGWRMERAPRVQAHPKVEATSSIPKKGSPRKVIRP